MIEAAFALIVDGKGPPSVDDVAARAGVSVSSVFRNFDGMADLQQQALELFRDRYGHLVDAVPPQGASLDERIDFFVEHRLALYEQAHSLLAMARMRAFEHDIWSGPVANNRTMLADQVRASFRPECLSRTVARRTELVALLDSLTSPEVYDLMTRAHGRTRPQIARAWSGALAALIDADNDNEAITTRV